MLAHRNSKRSPTLYILLAFAIIVVLLFLRPGFATDISSKLLPGRLGLSPANATLGFGGLYVVSGPGSPRRQHLEEAARVTGLDFRIPPQVTWTDEDVRNFRPAVEEESHVLTGSVKAWLSHHVVLKEFLDSGSETAVIFEDDVDWDVRLLTEQIPLAQKAVRSMSKLARLDQKHYPWGTVDDWDLLYIGHCGDYFGDIQTQNIGVGHHHPHDLRGIPHKLYEDKTMLYRTDLHPFTASLLTAFHIPEQTRIVHKSQWPLCTFGYAITRRTAERILTDIAPPKEDPSRNIIAYDAAVLTGCRDGALTCFTITPELFHHMEGNSLIASEESSERIVVRPPVDEAGLEQTQWRMETSNIGCGFFDGSFYYDGDLDRLALLRDQVGTKGRCLKHGRDPQTGQLTSYD